MVKKIKIESLPKGSTFMHKDGKIGIIASINSMGARVRYKGKKRCVTISSSSPVIPHSSDKPTWVYNDGGRKCDKLDVKGLDIVRSNFPPAMRDLMT